MRVGSLERGCSFVQITRLQKDLNRVRRVMWKLAQVSSPGEKKSFHVEGFVEAAFKRQLADNWQVLYRYS